MKCYLSSNEVDRKWFLEILKTEYNSLIEILSLETFPTIKNLTILGSDDTRVVLQLLFENGSKIKRSLVLKSLPNTPKLRKNIADAGLFTTEIKIYKHALSRMQQVLDSVKDKSEPIWVRAFGFKEYEQLVLEDVVGELGYRTPGRWKGLDLDHSLLAINGLAKFHALAAVADEQSNYEIRSQFSLSLIENQYDVLNDFYDAIYYRFAKVIEEGWGPEWAPAAKKIREVAPLVKQRLFRLYLKRDAFLNTLNLGAPSNLFMYFRYDNTDSKTSGKPIAVRFPYFQMSFFNSSIHDLQYFLNTSPNIEVMTQHRHNLLSHYFQSLIYYLEKFGYKDRMPTAGEFLKEVERTNFEGITIAIQMLPVIFEPPRVVGTMERNAEKFMKDNKAFVDPYGSYTKPYSTYMKILLKRALDDNVL